MHGRAVDEARAEGALVALFEQALVGDEVLGAVGAVGHHDRHRVALEGFEAGTYGEAEAVAVGRGQAADLWMLGGDSRDHGRGVVGAGVVDDDHLVVDLLAGQRRDDALDRLGDRLLLVVGGDDDRELHAGVEAQRSALAS